MGGILGGVIDRSIFKRRPALRRSFRSARPFRHVVIDGFFEDAFCRKLADQFPQYDKTRFVNEHGHPGKAVHENVPELSPAFSRLDKVLRSGDFLGLMSGIAGIPGLLHDPDYFGAGAHENLEDMELDAHVDFTLHPRSGLYRRLNLLVYLNPRWDESWGGALELHTNPWLPPAQNPVKRVLPLFNRCVIFETSDFSWHGFETIRLPNTQEGLSRRSLALYFYSKQPAPGAVLIPHDLTVFVDRPLPERLQPGYTLSQGDVDLLRRLIVRRDWKLQHLYARAIALFNRSRKAENKLLDITLGALRLAGDSEI